MVTHFGGADHRDERGSAFAQVTKKMTVLVLIFCTMQSQLFLLLVLFIAVVVVIVNAIGVVIGVIGVPIGVIEIMVGGCSRDWCKPLQLAAQVARQLGDYGDERAHVLRAYLNLAARNTVSIA
jgi:hypothetical protein